MLEHDALECIKMFVLKQLVGMYGDLNGVSLH